MRDLKVSIIQSNLHWENKAANLAMFESKINAIGHTELVVLPEMFNTGFSMKPEQLAETMQGPTVQWMQRMAATNKIILTGSLIVEENGNYYNRLVWMLPNGQYASYDKRHLFAYAGEHEHYHSGNKRLVASVNGWKINLLVCYDLRFPVWARQQSDPDNGPEFDVLLYVANWPERRSHAWRTLLQARAIENQCYVIGVNRAGTDGNDIYYSGNSMIVNALGEIVVEKIQEECTHTELLSHAHIQDIRSKLPFLKDADRFSIEH